MKVWHIPVAFAVGVIVALVGVVVWSHHKAIQAVLAQEIAPSSGA